MNVISWTSTHLGLFSTTPSTVVSQVYAWGEIFPRGWSVLLELEWFKPTTKLIFLQFSQTQRQRRIIKWIDCDHTLFLQLVHLFYCFYNQVFRSAYCATWQFFCYKNSERPYRFGLSIFLATMIRPCIYLIMFDSSNFCINLHIDKYKIKKLNYQNGKM